MSEDDGRPTLDGICLEQRPRDRDEVVTVALKHFPVEGQPFIAQGFDIIAPFHESV